MFRKKENERFIIGGTSGWRYLVAIIECNFFGIGDDSWMNVAQVSFKICFVGYKFSKFRRNGLQYLARQEDNSCCQERSFSCKKKKKKTRNVIIW